MNKGEVCQKVINVDGSKTTMYGDMADILKSSINGNVDFLQPVVRS